MVVSSPPLSRLPLLLVLVCGCVKVLRYGFRSAFLRILKKNIFKSALHESVAKRISFSGVLRHFGPNWHFYFGERGENVDLSKILTENYELAEACFKTNYYGPKALCEVLIPLLQLSDSSRIVNVYTSYGSLEKFPSGWGKGVLSDAESLTEEKVEEVLKRFLADFKEGSLETKGWPTVTSAYTVCRACLNAYTRILAKKYPSFCINSVCPGYVKTNMNLNTGVYTVEEGAESIVRVALLPDGTHSGLFFRRSEIVPF